MVKITKLSQTIGAAMLSTLFVAPASAHMGAYIGGNLGYGYIKTPSGSVFTGATTTTTSRGKLGASGLLGYQFNSNFALEGSYIYFGDSTYNATLGANSANLKYKTDAFDIAAKGIIPFDAERWDIFGKAGVAYARQRTTYSNAGSIPLNIASPIVNTNKYVPLLGVGASYNFTPQLAGDVSYTHLFGTGNFSSDNKAIASNDYVGVGLVYHFDTF